MPQTIAEAYSPEAIEAEGRRIFESYVKENGVEAASGGFCASGALRARAEEWVHLVEQEIPRQNARGIQHLLSFYPALHLMAFGKPARDAFINQWHEKVLMLLAKGEKGDKVVLMRWMRKRLRENPRSVPPQQRLWYCDVIARWVRECRSFIPLSKYSRKEGRGIAEFLLEENLQVFIHNQTSFKSRLMADLRRV